MASVITASTAPFSSAFIASMIPALVVHIVIGFFVYSAPDEDLSELVMASLPHVASAHAEMVKEAEEPQFEPPKPTPPPEIETKKPQRVEGKKEEAAAAPPPAPTPPPEVVPPTPPPEVVVAPEPKPKPKPKRRKRKPKAKAKLKPIEGAKTETASARPPAEPDAAPTEVPTTEPTSPTAAAPAASSGEAGGKAGGREGGRPGGEGRVVGAKKAKGAGGQEGADLKGLARGYYKRVHGFVSEEIGPSRAIRRLGLEGKVVLAVTINAAGKILAVSVLKTSGHAALDRAAVKKMKGLGQLPTPPDALGWTRKKFKVPVVFKQT